MGEKAFISIGSNQGDRLLNCKKAVEQLSVSVKVLSRSSFYETKAWGVTDQPDFVNLAVEIDTELEPKDLLAFLKSIEVSMGRSKAEDSERWGARIIDLDIIYFGSIVLDTEELTVPHPLMQERAFVLVPLSEIAPAFIHPVLKKETRELLEVLDYDNAECVPFGIK
jgi:2-amino-4-hydroxy-6-hydroxymethyldihydropteridine diphosphokinase